MADGFFSKAAGQDRRKWLNEAAGQFVPPELRKWMQIADMMNPVSDIGRAGQSANRMMDPKLSGWDRAAAGGDMLVDMASVVAPAAASKMAGAAPTKALMEGLFGWTPDAEDAVGRFAGSEYGGVELNSKPFFHGTPDGRGVRGAGGFSPDKPVYLSDSRQVAGTYADDMRAFDYQNAIPEVFSAKTSPHRVLDVNAGGADFRGIDAETVRQALSRAGVSDEDSIKAFSQIRVRDDGKMRTDDLVKIVKDLGFDAADVANVRDTYNNAAKSKPSTVRMMMNPSQISIDGMSPPTKAQQIADMLSQGRAGDVTDDLMAQADPSELWKLYESGATGADMPMDAASRMARAEGMGFDTGTPLYHGTAQDFQSFNPSFRGGVADAYSAQRADWLADSPTTAQGYADMAGKDAPVARLIKQSEAAERAGKWDEASDLMVQAERLEANMPDSAGQTVLPIISKRPQTVVDANGGSVNELEWPMRDAITDAKKSGDVGVEFRNFSDHPDYSVEDPALHRGIFNASDIRSRFARFDPRLKHLANLSAGGAGVAYMGGQDDNKAQIRAWLEAQK